MKLFVLRHGKAGDGFPDSIRELTDRGYRQIERVVDARRHDLSTLDAVLTSPLTRARQTLDHALAELDASFVPGVTENLTPGASPARLCEELTDLHAENILVASHQPFVSDLVEFLTGDWIDMSTGTLVAIETDQFAPGWGELLWVERPGKG